MANTETKPQSATKAEPLDAKLCDAMKLPEGDVMLRRVGGPDGLHAKIGGVKLGRVYCVSASMAAKVIAATPGEFELVFDGHRAAIEAASKKAEAEAKNTANKNTK